MNTVISFTPAQLVSVLLAICAAIVTIANATKANVRKADNGDYYLDFE